MKNAIMKCITLLMLCALIPLASGCHEVKAEAASVPDDIERMLTEAVAEKSPVPTQEGAKIVSEKYTNDAPLKNSDGTLTVAIDAEVMRPTDAEMPTVRVVPHDFSAEECSRFANTLFHGEPMYNGKRLELAEQISRWTEALASGVDKETETGMMEDLANWQTELDDLPDEPIHLEEILQTTDERQIHIISDGQDGVWRDLCILLAPEDCMNQLQYLASTNGIPEIRNVWSTATSAGRKHGEEEYGSMDQIANPQKTAEESVAEAQALLHSLKLDAYGVQSTELVFGEINGKLQKAWQLSFTHEINGIPLTYSSYTLSDFGSGQLSEDEQGNMQPVWPEEFLDVLVTDEGITRMRWSSPFEVEEIVTQDTSTLPFEEVSPILEDMLLTQYAPSQSGVHEEIQVDRVVLGLGRILDEESLRSGLLIPMWTAYGTQTFYREGSSSIVEDPDAELIRLNAVDGTVMRGTRDIG